MRGWSSVKLPWKLHSALAAALRLKAFARKCICEKIFNKMAVFEAFCNGKSDGRARANNASWHCDGLIGGKRNRFAPTYTFQMQCMQGCFGGTKNKWRMFSKKSNQVYDTVGVNLAWKVSAGEASTLYILSLQHFHFHCNSVWQIPVPMNPQLCNYSIHCY